MSSKDKQTIDQLIKIIVSYEKSSIRKDEIIRLQSELIERLSK